jgi:hypothetical protein
MRTKGGYGYILASKSGVLYVGVTNRLTAERLSIAKSWLKDSPRNATSTDSFTGSDWAKSEPSLRERNR